MSEEPTTRLPRQFREGETDDEDLLTTGLRQNHHHTYERSDEDHEDEGSGHYAPVADESEETDTPVNVNISLPLQPSHSEESGGRVGIESHLPEENPGSAEDTEEDDHPHHPHEQSNATKMDNIPEAIGNANSHYYSQSHVPLLSLCFLVNWRHF